jgi:hypothetical protein
LDKRKSFKAACTNMISIGPSIKQHDANDPDKAIPKRRRSDRGRLATRRDYREDESYLPLDKLGDGQRASG